MIVAEVYLRGIIGETRTGWTPLKATTVGLLVLLPILSTFYAMYAQRGFMQVLIACLSCWLFFSLFVAIRAFTDHPGLAHDVPQTPAGFARTLAVYFGFFGMPLGLIQAAVVLWLRRLAPRRSPHI